MRRIQKAVLGALVLLPVLTGIALATPGINVLGFPPVARGTHAEPLNVHS